MEILKLPEDSNMQPILRATTQKEAVPDGVSAGLLSASPLA